MDKILFQDIQAAYVNRYQFFPVPGTTDQFDVLPIRGAVTVQGTPVRAQELNQLQENVDEAKLDKSAVADFVVEQGTSGYWTYRKWKSGTAEGWCTRSITLNLSTQFGYVYAGQNESIDLPNGLFSSTDGMYVQLTGNNLWTASCDIKAVDALAIKFFSGYKYENSVGSYDIYVKGRWK
nr:MAG TPA: hypothetical protein [Caudoviricetes sp.]